MMEIAEKQENTLTSRSIDEVYRLIADDMTAVNQLIEQRLQSDVALINQLSHYIINSGGKRLRPILVLLSAGAFGYQGKDYQDKGYQNKGQGKQHINLAAIVEFIHTATLLHDDVVDASEVRRGNETANTIWGNEAAVLVGDFLYSRAFQMMVDADSMRIMTILSNATNIIAEGEVLQLLNCHDPNTTEQRYLDVIRYKTAKLFEAAAQLGAVLNHATPEQEDAMARYGMHLGTAFQLVDDVLDYSADELQTGKHLGDDLAEGKPTLPLIYAMQHGSTEQAAVVRSAIEHGDVGKFVEVLQIIRATGALDFTRQQAMHEAESACAAIAVLPDSKYKRCLLELANFAATRQF